MDLTKARYQVLKATKIEIKRELRHTTAKFVFLLYWYVSFQLYTCFQDVDAPEHFPFHIVDNPGDQAVVLKRELAGENIQVTVFMNFDEQNDMEQHDEADEDDDSEENSMEPTLSLVVTIDKGEGPLLEFCCNLNSDELQIESMVLKKRDDLADQSAYQGPKFT